MPIYRGDGRARYWAALTALSIFLGAFVAVLVNTVLFGRVPLPQLLRGWSGSITLTAVSLCVALWWFAYAGLLQRRCSTVPIRLAVVPALPLILGAAIPVISIYLSDLANHYFYSWMIDMNQPKAMALLLILLMATLLLQAVHLELAPGVAPRTAVGLGLARVREPLVLVLLAALGTLQGASYVGHLDNDSMRYWVIADAMSTGSTYPAWPTYSDFVIGGMTPYTIDLPLFPALLAASFTLFGHTAAASYLPRLLANVVLPPLTYLLFRELIPSRALALSLTSFVVLFPPLRFYTLNWAGSDAAFLAVLMAAGWLYARMVKGDQRWATWLFFGLLAAATALARPEGAAYAGIYVVAAMMISTWAWRKLATLALFLVPVAIFSAEMMDVFGVPWPRNFVGSMGVQNVVANWEVLNVSSLQILATGLRLSVFQLAAFSAVLVLVALIGSWPTLYRPRLLFVLMLPAWINLLSVVLVDPLVSGARLWFDFFRHISYVIPFLVLGSAVASLSGLRLVNRTSLRWVGLVALNGMLLWAVLWDVHLLTKPSWNFGADAGNLLGAGRVNLVDVVTHPYPLPVFGYQMVQGFNVAVTPSEFISKYPEQINDFFGRFDAVRRTAGTPYQAGSQVIFLAGLVLQLLSLVATGLPKAGTKEVPLP